MPVCQICGAENPVGAEYCQDCGSSLTAQAPQSAPSEQAPTVPQSTPATPAPATPEVPAAPEAASAPAPEVTSPAPDAAPVVPAPPPDAPQPPAAGQNPRLVTNRYGAPSGEEYPLLADRLVVGRFDPETGPVDLDLSQTPESPQISRHHAELYREADGQWYVKDLGSTNGVFVKSGGSPTFGPRITTPQALAAGDEIAFGNARFILRMD